MHILQVATPDASNVAEKFSADSLANKGAQLIETLQTTPPKEILSDLTTSAIQFGLKVLAALVIYLIGAWIIKRVKRALERLFIRKQTDRAMASFISSFVSIARSTVTNMARFIVSLPRNSYSLLPSASVPAS